MLKRVGVLIPSTNTAVEAELSRHLPDNAAVHAARMYFGDGENAMLDTHLPNAVRDLASCRPDVVVFACTTAGALRGSAYEQGLIEQISAKTGVPTVSIMASVVEELQRRGVRRVGVITPYPEHSNRLIQKALEEAGFEVPVCDGLGIRDGVKIVETTPEQLIDFGLRVLAGHDVDVVFLSCTALMTLDHIARFEAAFGKPVVSSLSAALDKVDRLLAVPAGA